MALYIDDEKVGGIKELCAQLQIDSKDIPYRKRTKEFIQMMDRDIHGAPKRDQDGNYRTKRKIAGVPQFSAYIPKLGYEVRVRLATTQRMVDDNYDYQPKLITMDPAEDGTCIINDDLEFVFWFLHPWCNNSPLRQIGTPAYYEFKDEDNESKISNDFEEASINALGYIIGNHSKPITQLRNIAKGMNVLGVDDMTDDVVKKKLRDIARANPIEFINKVDSREIIFSGEVQDAVDRGILKTESLNGMVRWYLNGKEIIPVPYGMDAMAVLKQELSANWYLYSQELKEAISGSTIAENLNRVHNDDVFDGSESHKIDQKAELTAEQRVYLKKMEEEQWFDEKIKKLAQIDPTDVTVHHATLKSYEANKAAVEAYKKSLALEMSPA